MDVFVDITAEEIAKALNGKAIGSKKWSCLCPAHKDHNPSLAVSEGAKGIVLLKCWAGCSQEKVLAALRKRGLWPEQRVRPENKAGADTKAPPEEQSDWVPIFPPPCEAMIDRAESMIAEREKRRNPPTTHRYTDLQGNITHYIQRFEAENDIPKRFIPLTWGRLDGDEGWHTRHLNPPLPLYGLHKLNLADPDQVVVLCEGEKAADGGQARLDQTQEPGGPDEPKPTHPLVAFLSWSGGKGAVLDADLAPLLQHQGMICIWPDADAGGRRAACQLVIKLAKLGVPQDRLKLVYVDDLPEKHDAADEEFQDAEDPFDWWLDRLRPPQTLADYLSAEAWMKREVPPPERLLGDWITTGSRTIIYGPTGVGKTMFGLALSEAMASGTEFLDWIAARPARVLYIDGEMQPTLIKQRIITAFRREATGASKGNLLVFSRLWEDETIRQFPELGPMPPLNTKEGLAWVTKLIDHLEMWGDKIDVGFFDNIQALLGGDKRDETAWTSNLDLVNYLTRRRIAQIWFDHTGHDTSRLYGSSVKMWQVDNVVGMKPHKSKTGSEDDQDGEVIKGLLPFVLSHDKARMRGPDNYLDFAPRMITYEDGVWRGRDPNKVPKPLTALQQQYLDALKQAIAEHPAGQNKTTRDAWIQKLVSANVITKDDRGKVPVGARNRLSDMITTLNAKGLVSSSGDDGEFIKYRGD